MWINQRFHRLHYCENPCKYGTSYYFEKETHIIHIVVDKFCG